MLDRIVMDEKLIKRIKKAQEGDQDVLNELIKENYGLVHSIGRRFENRGYEMEDIYQIGAIGLLKAIKKFDFSYNVVLSTFAVAYIIGEIKRFLRDDGPVKISRELKQLASKIYIEKKENPCITINELAKKMHTKKENILLAIESSNLVESLDSKIDDDSTCLMERISSNDNNEDKIIEKITLKELINKLEPREQKIILLRYYKGQTQAKVADIIGISQVQVSRLEKQVLRNLKKNFKEG